MKPLKESLFCNEFATTEVENYDPERWRMAKSPNAFTDVEKSPLIGRN